MTVYECEKNKVYKVIDVNVKDKKLKIHLYEIGFYPNSEIQVLNISWLKKTFIVQVLDSCFAIKGDMAKLIGVEYA